MIHRRFRKSDIYITRAGSRTRDGGLIVVVELVVVCAIAVIVVSVDVVVVSVDVVVSVEVSGATSQAVGLGKPKTTEISKTSTHIFGRCMVG
jgi:hypothetical protein